LIQEGPAAKDFRWPEGNGGSCLACFKCFSRLAAEALPSDEQNPLTGEFRKAGFCLGFIF
jgi:hypothetical protein